MAPKSHTMQSSLGKVLEAGQAAFLTLLAAGHDVHADEDFNRLGKQDADRFTLTMLDADGNPVVYNVTTTRR